MWLMVVLKLSWFVFVRFTCSKDFSPASFPSRMISSRMAFFSSCLNTIQGIISSRLAEAIQTLQPIQTFKASVFILSIYKEFNLFRQIVSNICFRRHGLIAKPLLYKKLKIETLSSTMKQFESKAFKCLFSVQVVYLAFTHFSIGALNASFLCPSWQKVWIRNHNTH